MKGIKKVRPICM